MSSEMASNQDYRVWIGELKGKFRQAQLTAAIKVNATLLAFYWELGADISVWGEGFLTRLSQDLMAEFPEVKGFSKRNLEQIRRWYCFWQGDSAIAKQAASQITRIPWWHNVIIASKSQTQQEALYYVANTLKNGWSRSVLTHQIESRLWQREGKATHNFAQTLPTLQSDLAQQTLKDPYVFDFLSLTNRRNGVCNPVPNVYAMSEYIATLNQGQTFRTGQHAPSGLGFSSFTRSGVTAIKLRSALVSKLQLGNPDGEAPASRDGKLELPALNSQAGAWELAQSRWNWRQSGRERMIEPNVRFSSITRSGITAIKLRSALVPKLQLGNPDGEALASRDGKLELPALNSQAGAWELAQSRRNWRRSGRERMIEANVRFSNRRDGVCNPVPNVYAMSECMATLNQGQTFRTGQHAPSGLGNQLFSSPIEQWLHYANARIDTANDYDKDKAEQCLILMKDFIDDAIGLYQTMTRTTWE